MCHFVKQIAFLIKAEETIKVSTTWNHFENFLIPLWILKIFRNPKVILNIFVIQIQFWNWIQTIEVQVIRVPKSLSTTCSWFHVESEMILTKFQNLKMVLKIFCNQTSILKLFSNYRSVGQKSSKLTLSEKGSGITLWNRGGHYGPHSIFQL